MNWVDIIILGFIIYALFQGYRRGFVIGVLSVFNTAIALFSALYLYSPTASWLAETFLLNPKVTPFFTFLFLILLMETIGGFVIAYFDAMIVRVVYRLKPLAYLDSILGVLPSFVVTTTFAVLITLLPVTVPFAQGLRKDIQSSWWGRNVLPAAYAYVPKLEGIARQLPTQSLLYIIPRSPTSEENIALNLPQQLVLTVDEVSERRMLDLVNQERVSRGLNKLAYDQNLTAVARAHSKDMFERHYFSHVNPDGKTPFDRMDAAGITYVNAGENLAYAPDVDIAHTGLMNSPGHRANILRPEFGHVGIGVTDGGIYGKMFSQEFTN